MAKSVYHSCLARVNVGEPLCLVSQDDAIVAGDDLAFGGITLISDAIRQVCGPFYDNSNGTR
jgi:hypothetical protein